MEKIISKIHKKTQYHTYILKCQDNTLYTGITTNIARRLKEHNTTALGAKYTRARRPVTLVYSCAYPTRSEAQRAEFSIKKLSKNQKILLIQDKQKTTNS
ncbi:MAG: GIY-YIG nuclease family protein [Microgenomates group bacterium]